MIVIMICSLVKRPSIAISCLSSGRIVIACLAGSEWIVELVDVAVEVVGRTGATVHVVSPGPGHHLYPCRRTGWEYGWATKAPPEHQ